MFISSIYPSEVYIIIIVPLAQKFLRLVKLKIRYCVINSELHNSTKHTNRFSFPALYFWAIFYFILRLHVRNVRSSKVSAINNRCSILFIPSNLCFNVTLFSFSIYCGLFYPAPCTQSPLKVLDHISQQWKTSAKLQFHVFRYF